jgi:hypothetical protein
MAGIDLLFFKLADRLDKPNKGMFGPAASSGEADPINKCKSELRAPIGALMFLRQADPGSELEASYAKLKTVLGLPPALESDKPVKDYYFKIKNSSTSLMRLPAKTEGNPTLNTYMGLTITSNIIDILMNDVSRCKESERVRNLVQNSAKDGKGPLDLVELKDALQTLASGIAATVVTREEPAAVAAPPPLPRVGLAPLGMEAAYAQMKAQGARGGKGKKTKKSQKKKRKTRRVRG